MTLAGTASCDDRRSQRLYLPSANSLFEPLAFTENRFGYACAMAVIVFLLALVLTGLFNKFRGSVDRSVGNA